MHLLLLLLLLMMMGDGCTRSSRWSVAINCCCRY